MVTNVTNLETIVLLGMGVLLIAGTLFGLAGIAALPEALPQVQLSQPARPASETMGNRAEIQPGLTIRDHAKKHGDETEIIYRALLEGKCAGSMTWCGGSDIEKLHVCIDPVTGVVGAVLQYGTEITTGFYERPSSGYWFKRIEWEDWGICQ